jgi:ADP-ribose pyrophosphatase YjhB (NUDIX family)
MAGEVITIYADQQAPESWDACIAIGVSAPESGSAGSWRSEVVSLLQENWAGGAPLVVLIPEPQSRRGDVRELTGWYARALDVADVVMFWWPDDADPWLMATSLTAWNDGQRVVHGTPPDGPLSHSLAQYADANGISAATTLAGMVRSALSKIGPGARRTGGEREVPLPVWRTDSFQRWYDAQAAAGNTLLGARQVWAFNAGPNKQFVLYWALHVRVYVRAEDRIKSNEVVISRPDISVLALYKSAATIAETTIVLVREFRSPASTPDGHVHELPGGSAADGQDALHQAIRETEEETGLAIEVRRIRAHGSRQLAATVSAHHAHLFTAEITDDELALLRASQSIPHGAGDTEQTWTEITTFGQIRQSRLVDWATLGMIAEAVLDRNIGLAQ